MPLDADQEQLEHELKVMQMRAEIRNKDVDTELKLQQARWEPWKVVTTVFGATAAVFGAIGVLIGTYVRRIEPPAPSPPQVIYVLPGQAPPSTR